MAKKCGWFCVYMEVLKNSAQMRILHQVYHWRVPTRHKNTGILIKSIFPQGKRNVTGFCMAGYFSTKSSAFFNSSLTVIKMFCNGRMTIHHRFVSPGSCQYYFITGGNNSLHGYSQLI